MTDIDGMDIIDGGDRITFNNDNHDDAVAAFMLLSSRTKNAFLAIEGDKNIRNQTRDLSKTGYYGNWSVFSASNFELGLAALSSIGNITGRQLDNLVIQAHGFQGSESAMKINSVVSAAYTNFLYNGDIDRVLGHVQVGQAQYAESLAKVSQLQGLSNLVADKGNFIFAVCDVGNGALGRQFAQNLNELTDQRLNIFLSTGKVKTVIGKDVKTGEFNNWLQDSFKVDNSPGWLHISPNGNQSYLNAIKINRTGPPIKLVK